MSYKKAHHWRTCYGFSWLVAVVVQSLGHVQLLATQWISECDLPALEFAQTRLSSWWCHPTISSSVVPFSSHLQSFPASGSFSSESALLIRWPKYWSFSFSINPSNEYSELISTRFDWFDLLAAQGTIRSILQHRSLKGTILWCSAFFMVQLSHQYMTTRPIWIHK